MAYNSSSDLKFIKGSKIFMETELLGKKRNKRRDHFAVPVLFLSCRIHCPQMYLSAEKETEEKCHGRYICHRVFENGRQICPLAWVDHKACSRTISWTVWACLVFLNYFHGHLQFSGRMVDQKDLCSCRMQVIYHFLKNNDSKNMSIILIHCW